MTVKYSFEDLEVWKKAVDFSKRVIDLTDQITTDRKHFRLVEQLESSAASIALNIAEGPEKCKAFPGLKSSQFFELQRERVDIPKKNLFNIYI